MMKRICTLLLILTILVCLPLTAYAHDVPQDRNDCSIEVIVRYDGKDVDGGTLTAIKVGYVDSEDGNYSFYQEKTGEKIEDIASSGAPAVQKEFYNNNKDSHEFYTQTQSVKNGKATFSDLPTGLYLIVQDKAAKGFHKLGSFLVSVPYLENDEYQYHVTAEIKSELEREPEPTEPAPPKPSDPTLPQTGQLKWPVAFFTVLGLILFVLGWMMFFVRRHEENEA